MSPELPEYMIHMILHLHLVDHYFSKGLFLWSRVKSFLAMRSCCDRCIQKEAVSIR